MLSGLAMLASAVLPHTLPAGWVAWSASSWLPSRPSQPKMLPSRPAAGPKAYPTCLARCSPPVCRVSAVGSNWIELDRELPFPGTLAVCCGSCFWHLPLAPASSHADVHLRDKHSGALLTQDSSPSFCCAALLFAVLCCSPVWLDRRGALVQAYHSKRRRRGPHHCL